jgi:hypothetical protein
MSNGGSIFAAGLGLGAAVILWTRKHHHHVPAAAPAPVHTVIVHSVTHTVTRVVAAHPLLTGTEVVIIAVAFIAAVLVIGLNLIGRLA